VKDETKQNNQKQATEGPNRPNVSSVLAKSGTLKAILDRIKAFGPELQYLGIDEMLADAELTKRGQFTADAILITEAQAQAKRDLRTDFLTLPPADRGRALNAVARRKRMFADDSRIKQRLTDREKQLLRVYRKHPNATGMEWCLALNRDHVHPRSEWRVSTYPEAYQKGRKWQHRINDEKSKLVKKLAAVASD
jgi:hypothetical protein